MAIALNAGSNPNGQTPSIGVHGDGNGTENSLLGNFGDLLTLISADAENAVHEKSPTPQMTAKHTNEALLAFAENGNEDTKLAISNILQKVAPENKNQLEPTVGRGIQTSSFLEAKIENKLQQQDLVKPYKIIELISLADLEAFGKDFELTNAEIPKKKLLNENYEITAPAVAPYSESLINQHYMSNNPVASTASGLISDAVVSTASGLIGDAVVSTASGLIGDAVVSTASGLIGDAVVSTASGLIGNTFMSKPPSLIGSAIVTNTPDPISNDENILTPFLSSSAALKPNSYDIIDIKSTIGQINNPEPSAKHLLSKKDQLIVDLVNNILQVDSASLVIGETGPSEAIFDLRDLKEAIVQKFSLPLQDVKEVKVPSELVIPYTLPLRVANGPTQVPIADVAVSKIDILDVTKITLDRNLIELPVPDEIKSVENAYTEKKSFTVKNGELLLTSSPTLDRKLVIGITIPKNSKVDELPDFVKIQINLDDGKTLTDATRPSLKANKEYLTSNLIELSKGQFTDDNPSRLVENVQKLLTALGQKNTGLAEDTHIVSINKFNKLSPQILPNLASKGLLTAEAFSDDFINQSLKAPGTIIEKNTVPEYLDSKTHLNGPDKLSAILNIGLIDKFDTKKHTTASRATTSVLALGANANLLMNSNKELWAPGVKEKSNTFSSQANFSGDGPTKNIFEIISNKKLNEKLFDPAEIKKIPQPQNNIATLAPTSDKTINPSMLGSERVLSSNHMPAAPALVENKISLYEAQYASRLGMAVVEKVRAGKENFDIHLQPESFGKIKVNVNLDFRAMDVKIFTETLAAATIFKDHESTLQQIMEQNGMKLASFSVGSQNGNEQQRQFANQNKDKTMGKVNGRENKVITTPNMTQNSSGEQSGLNLIA